MKAETTVVLRVVMRVVTTAAGRVEMMAAKKGEKRVDCWVEC